MSGSEAGPGPQPERSSRPAPGGPPPTGEPSGTGAQPQGPPSSAGAPGAPETSAAGAPGARSVPESGSRSGSASGSGGRPRNPTGPGTLPRVPGYRIEGVLGRGSTGVVYRATQLAVDRPVALKVLHPEVSRGRAARRLQREARTTARLQHPNIVSAIDMGSIDGVWWYAMELVEGPSLAARLRREGRLTERAALRLFIPLCEALAHLAHHGVVHRDIKPANVLVDQNGRARLVDLGLAFAEDDPSLTVQGGTLGTPHYVSPEQARDAGEADTRSDLWSLGASLFHALTGRPPFSGESVAEIISSVLYDRIPDPGEVAPDLSRGMRLVLRKCLARSPERRYQTPEELLEDLERLRERRQVSVQRSELDPLEGDERRARRRLVTAGLLFGLGAAAAAIALAPPGGWFGAPGSEPEPRSAIEEGSAAAELEELARLGGRPEPGGGRAEAGRRLLAPALARLEVLQGELPPGFERRFAEVRADLRRHYNDEAAKLRARFARELQRALERRDYVAAGALVEGGLEDELNRELAPSPAQLLELLRLFDVEARRRDVEGAAERALGALGERLGESYREGVIADATELAGRGRWRTARELLAGPGAEHLERAGIETSGLPEARVRAVVDGVRTALVEPALAELERGWRRFDRDLEAWTLERASELERELEERRANDVADRLFADVDERRRMLGLESSEALDELADRAGEALARRARELAALEERLLREDAERILAERIERAEPLWRAREYAELRELWIATLERTYLEPERRRLATLSLEAELLEELLTRAAEGLAELPADQPALLTFGSIGAEGMLGALSDPLEEPFLLRPIGAGAGGGAELRLSLRARPGAQRLSGHDVERLAGLGGASTGRERLVRALFRWREGDLPGTAALLPLPGLPDPELDRLATELVRRVGRSLEERDQGREEREAEARTLEHLINRVIAGEAVHAADRAETLERIDRLLVEFGDLDYVRRREPELRFLKQRLVAEAGELEPADFREAFGATDVALDRSRRRVALTFALAAIDPSGAFSAGDWDAVADGWEAPTVSSRAQLEDERRWPRLVLSQPLDLDQPLAVELEVLQPRGSGPPQLLLVSVAGVHVALRSDAHGGPRLLARSGSAEALRELLVDVLERGRGEPMPGLRRGARHRLGIELSRGRGRVDVRLDGVPIGQEDLPRPLDGPGSASVVVRSLEPVRLVRAEIRAGYRVR